MFNRSMLVVLLAGFALVACKDEAKSTTTTSASVTPGSTATAPATVTAATTAAVTAVTATAVVVSPEMNAFVAMLDGKDGSARKALKKYGANAAIQGDDVGMYMLTSPKVTKSEKVGDLQCFTFESSAGVMKHTTQTCWDAKGKISKLTDTSQ